MKNSSYIFSHCKLTGNKSRDKVNYRLLSPAVYNSKRLPLSCREYIDYTEDKTIINSAFNREDDENKDTKISGEEEVKRFVRFTALLQ